METCIIREHEESKVELPVKHGVIAEACQIYCKCLFGIFSLAVAMGMVWQCGEMLGA